MHTDGRDKVLVVSEVRGDAEAREGEGKGDLTHQPTAPSPFLRPSLACRSRVSCSLALVK